MLGLVIDGRKGMSQAEVRRIAQKHFGIKPIQEDSGPNPGDHGFFLAGDPLHYYHVSSVCPGMYVASTSPLTPEVTRPMVEAYLKEWNTKNFGKRS